MRVWCSIIISFALLPGCVDDAPRDNPLDPLSLQYIGEGSLTGRTVVVKITIGGYEITGVSGVNIFHVESGMFVVTDSAGYFAFNKLPEGKQTFICTKPNFTSDTFQVQIQSQSPSSIERWLNGAPQVLSKNILTRKIDYVSFNPEYFVDIEADVTDPNGINDLKTVWFKTKDSLYTMPYDTSRGKFFIRLFKIRFPTNTIQVLTGDSLRIVSRDGSGATNISEPFFVSRIIENGSTPLSPASSEEISRDSLILKWKPPEITFNYTSTVTVVKDDPENESVVMTIPGLISFYEQYPYEGGPISIQDGNYYWYVTIIDDFGNYSRSKEAYFTVKP